MQSKIKQVTLVDGKQIFYPSEEEVAKLYEYIKEVVIEDTLTRDEYDGYVEAEMMERFLINND